MKKGYAVLKRAAVVALPAASVAANAVTSFASETGGTSLADTATSALTSAVTDMASSVAGAIGASFRLLSLWLVPALWLRLALRFSLRLQIRRKEGIAFWLRFPRGHCFYKGVWT